MLVIYGNTITRQKAGWVADFCPCCRHPQPFLLTAVFSSRHISGFSTGSRSLLRHEIDCATCGMRMGTDAERYLSIEKKRPADLLALISLTMPDIAERMGERLATEKLIRENLGALDPIVRKQYLFEPFQILNWNLEDYESFGKTDLPSTLGCFGTVAIGVILVLARIYVPEPYNDAVCLIVFGLGILGFFYTLAQSYFIPHRFLNRRILPNLARALKPLAPREQELETVLHRCRTLHLQIGMRLKLRKLLAAMR